MANGVLFRPDEPIIGSILETDVYKILMLFFIMKYFDNLDVTFAFTNRTVDVKLAEHVDVDQLREELKHAATLRFTKEQIAHLRTWELFPEWFLKRLLELRLSVPEVVPTGDGQFSIRAHGNWAEVTLWELIVLPVTNELYSRKQIGLGQVEQSAAFKGANEKLSAKIDFLNLHPDLFFALFGFRRRASGLFERHVTKRFHEELQSGTMIGTSNVQIAREFGIEAVGTNAHELPMAVYALRRHESNTAARDVPFEVLRLWQQLYGHKLLIILPDTFGSDYVLNNITYEMARDFRGWRQDSGDPIQFGEKVLAMYRRLGIDATEKLIIFSDGLSVEKMFAIRNHFYGRINVSFGVGTNFTNDFLTHIALSIVMKLIEAAGRPAVKLPDNLAKAIGEQEEVEFARWLYQNTTTYSEQPIY